MKNKSRIIVWGVIWFISLGLGITGLIVSEDIKKLSFLYEWIFKDRNTNESVEIDFNKVTQDLNDYLDLLYGETENYTGVASYVNNTISVQIQTDKVQVINFEINDNIISNEESLDSDVEMNFLLFMKIVESVESYYGLSSEEVVTTLISNSIENFTLENDGIEIKRTNNFTVYKLDISKKITILKIDKHLTVEEVIKNNGLINALKTNETSQVNKSYVTVHTSQDDNGNALIRIFEKENITSISYNSLISIITVFLNENEANEFKNLYSSFSLGSNETEKYKIEVEPQPDPLEQTIIGNNNLKLIRITIK